MTRVRHRTKAPGRWRLFACGLFFLANSPIAARAEGLVDMVEAYRGCVAPSPLARITAAIGWQKLTPKPGKDMPVPAESSFSSFNTTVAFRIKEPLRSTLEACVPAKLGNVLAFYRTELGKLGWQEKPDGTVVAADQAQLAFASPRGPALLKLGRRNGNTSVSLVQKNSDAATKTNLMPVPGQAMLVFDNKGDNEAVLTIDKRTITIADGQRNALSLDLPPGEYSYELRVAGHPARADTLTIAAEDTWELTVGPDGNVRSPLQLY
ncbi:hypothetical protein NLM33_29020 [Bradyrhizobium sp. CCGUVB1N3]|uniref:hypothetical protein n=1 Tax=Bradyrhizobium sp. CCGUVB1N3 TaxID=2949629 RepID=UPI0020B3EC1C|nr:hypothetical protein [Bradyrhizobium sp. CCGUVB1N3]MCP3474362.1 hypothetical protein [Bradyrhizobium sp. CCGUVB1N3]